MSFSLITNQSGIARGYYTEEDFIKLNDWMLEDLKSMCINISKVYYCPHHSNEKNDKYSIECECRKPKLGMYKEAIKEFDIDLEQSYTISDKISDSALCDKYNCHGYLISDLEKESIVDDVKNGKYRNIRYAVDLFSAAK